MPLSQEQVRHVAQLARLNLSTSEIEQFSHDLTRIIDYIDQLSEVDTSSLENGWSESQKIAQNVFREDEIRPSLPREKALANAPDKDDEYFHVPKVIG